MILDSFVIIFIAFIAAFLGEGDIFNFINLMHIYLLIADRLLDPLKQLILT